MKPGDGDRKRIEEAVAVISDVVEPAAREAFTGAVDTILEAWLAGTFFPRLVETDSDQQPRACAYCSVAEACLRGDSAARGRLRDWTARRRAETPSEEIFLRAWWLASTREKAS